MFDDVAYRLELAIRPPLRTLESSRAWGSDCERTLVWGAWQGVPSPIYGRL